MSVAFVREERAEAAAELALPARPLSPHPSVVTADGKSALKKALKEARAAYDLTRKIEDVDERRRAAGPALRE
jgi:hypothetical protein